jgi:hypothetical protein
VDKVVVEAVFSVHLSSTSPYSHQKGEPQSNWGRDQSSAAGMEPMTMSTTAPTMSAAKAKKKKEQEEEEEKENFIAQSVGDMESEAEPEIHTSVSR